MEHKLKIEQIFSFWVLTMSVRITLRFKQTDFAANFGDPSDVWIVEVTWPLFFPSALHTLSHGDSSPQTALPPHFTEEKQQHDPLWTHWSPDLHALHPYATGPSTVPADIRALTFTKQGVTGPPHSF